MGLWHAAVARGRSEAAGPCARPRLRPSRHRRDLWRGQERGTARRAALKGRTKRVLLASKCRIVVDGARRGVDCSPDAITPRARRQPRAARGSTISTSITCTVSIPRSASRIRSARSRTRSRPGKIGAYGVSEWSSAHIREATRGPSGRRRADRILAVDPQRRTGRARHLQRTRASPSSPFPRPRRGALGGEITDPSTLEASDLRHQMPRFNPRELAAQPQR